MEIRRGAQCGAAPGGVSARPAAADPGAIRCAHMEPFSIFKSILLVLRVVQRRQNQSPEVKSATKKRQAGCQKGRLDGCTESDPSQPDPAPAAVAGRQDREDENERISLDIFGYHLENWVRYLTRHLWRFCGDLYWRSLGYLKDIHGYLWISLLDLRLDIIWISKGDLCWISCGYVRFKRISFGYLLWKYD